MGRQGDKDVGPTGYFITMMLVGVLYVGSYGWLLPKSFYWSDKGDYKAMQRKVEKAEELGIDSCVSRMNAVLHYMNPDDSLFYKNSENNKQAFLSAKEQCKPCKHTIDSIISKEAHDRALEQFLNRPFGGQVGY